MELDPSSLDDAEARHKLISGLVVPRPIGWISTRHDGRDNLAPFSYYNAVNFDPPVVMFSATQRDGRRKHSADFAISSGAFVTNLVTPGVFEAMDRTSEPLAGESEFDFAEVERVPSKRVDAPRVRGALACFECRVVEHLDVSGATVIFGEVAHVLIADSLLEDGEVDARRVDAIGRIGGPYYTRIDRLGSEWTPERLRD